MARPVLIRNGEADTMIHSTLEDKRSEKVASGLPFSETDLRQVPPGYSPLPPSADPDDPNHPAQARTIRPPGAHTHDGFYLRLQLGEGFGRFTANDNGRHFEVSGPLTAYTIAVGAALTQNLILYGEALVGGFNDTKGKIDGKAAATANNSLGGFGVGVAYYWPAPNVYVAATLMIFQLEAGGKGSSADWGESFEGLVNQQGDAQTEPFMGVGGEAQVGKEWWISPHWGLGAAGEVFAGLAPDYDSGGNFTWTAMSFALLLSATYN